MTEIQKITLRDVFEQAGLTEMQIHDILLLLRYKPEKVQTAFYYVTIGFTQKQAADEIGCSQQQVNKYISNNCIEIKEYLKNTETYN